MHDPAAATLLRIGFDGIFPVFGVIERDGVLRCSCGKPECHSPGKHPACAHGVKDATCDLDDYRRLCAGRTNLNVAAACGAVVVIDVERDGLDDWERLVEELGVAEAVDATVWVASGGGGRHVLFTAPDGVAVAGGIKLLGSHIDVLAGGRYIVAAGSKHVSGGTYNWDPAHHPDRVTIAPIPAALLDRVNAAHAARNGSAACDDIKQPLTEGVRNSDLFALGRSLKAKGLAEDAIRAALRATNGSVTVPPVSDQEIDGIIASVLRQPDRPNFGQTKKFYGFASIEEVRTYLQQHHVAHDQLDTAYETEYVEACAALEHFSPSDYGRLPNILKGRGLALGRWERIVRETGRQEKARIKEEVEIQKAAIAAQPAPAPTWAPSAMAAQPVDGVHLLAELISTILAFVMMERAGALVVAIWILFTHLFEAVETNPFLRVISPTWNCGKSSLMKIIARLVRAGWLVSRSSQSAFARKLQTAKRTMLLDEGDAFLAENEVWRNILDGASDPDTATISISIKVGDNWVPTDLDVFAPIAIASIGRLRRMSTVESRSISVNLKRATREERKGLQKVRARTLKAILPPLAEKCARWADDNLDAFRSARPVMPEAMDGREQDKWEPMFAIAGLIGADTLTELSNFVSSRSADPAEEYSELIVVDIKEIFETEQIDRILQRDLCVKLGQLEGQPWAAYGRARKVINSHQLSMLLKPYLIVSHTIRVKNPALGGAEERGLGYELKDFDEAFQRYAHINENLNSDNGTTPRPVGESDDFGTVTRNPCHGGKNASNPLGQRESHVVTDEKADHGRVRAKNKPLRRRRKGEKF